jgi:hypothetical protein
MGVATRYSALGNGLSTWTGGWAKSSRSLVAEVVRKLLAPGDGCRSLRFDIWLRGTKSVQGLTTLLCANATVTHDRRKQSIYTRTCQMSRRCSLATATVGERFAGLQKCKAVQLSQHAQIRHMTLLRMACACTPHLSCVQECARGICPLLLDHVV